MTAQIVEPPPVRPTAAVRGSRWREWLLSWPVDRTLVAVIALVGAAVLIYPSAGAWFADRAHDGVVAGYAKRVQNLAPDQAARMMRRAHHYNAALPPGQLRDPYAAGPNGQQTATGAGAAAYFRQLDVGPDGVMGTLSYPAIGVTLPIYHGTGDWALDHGIGHLFGSALPVGGAGTHSVLTGHSGVVGKTLLDPLHHAKLGEIFYITTLGQRIAYRVDQINVVLPTDTSKLQPVSGKDYLTLLTCTPIGVNSHRLLVRGVRVPELDAQVSPADILHTAHSARFPWWILKAVGAVVSVVVLTALLGLGRKRSRKPRRDARRRRE